MKNNMLVLMLFLLVAAGTKAQNGQVEPSRSLTPAEVNRLSGTPNPTINGKPYSQFKAEQQAKQQQLEATKKNQMEAMKNSGSNTGLSVVPRSTAPVIERSTGPDDKTSNEKIIAATDKPETKTVDAGIGKTVKPEVPDALKLPTAQAWTGRPVADKTVEQFTNPRTSSENEGRKEVKTDARITKTEKPTQTVIPSAPVFTPDAGSRLDASSNKTNSPSFDPSEKQSPSNNTPVQEKTRTDGTQPGAPVPTVGNKKG